MKRTSSRIAKLVASKSESSPAVTLFRLDDNPASLSHSPEPEPGPSNEQEILRQSKRRRVQPKTQDSEDSGATATQYDVSKKEVFKPATPKPTSGISSAKKRTPGSSSPKKAKPISHSLPVPHPVPEHWRETYDLIKTMRAGQLAPVDTMGCEQSQNAEADPKNRRLSVLIALMLSSQTKDEVTDAAVKALRAALGGALSLPALLSADADTISNAIQKVGFWRRKTDYIMRTAVILRDQFESDVPKDIDQLCSLPGVGPKMGFLCLQSAWNINTGIGVDVHVDRITNRLGWHHPSTLGHPEKTRLNLESWLPKELFSDINHLLVGFGQTICLPQRPRCDGCLLSTNGLCPSAETVIKTKTRKNTTIKTASAKVEVEYEETSRVNVPPQ